MKAIAADEDGTVLARARVPHALHTPTPGAFEHDIDRAWRDDVLAALEQVGRGLDIAAVNVGAMIPSLGAVDGTGRAVGPGLLYGDHRGDRSPGTPAWEALRGASAGGDPAAEFGDWGELVAFLRWHARNTPGAAGFWPAQAVANHALTGRAAIDSTTATCALPLFNWTGWDADLAAELGVSTAALPDIVPGVRPIGTVRDGLAGAGAPVGGGTIDALGEQIVAGADEPGDVLVICGGTLITWAVAAQEAAVPGLWTVPHTVPGTFLVGGPSNAGGLFIDHVTRWLGGDAGDAPAHLPDDLPIWLPYLRGERTPLQRPDLQASMHDASLHHGAEHVRVAAFEATGFVVRRHLELAAPFGVRPRRIVATGGGVRSRVWMQCLADVTGLPVDVVAVPEGAALGSAFIARCSAGLESSLTDARRWARTSHRVEPDATRRDGTDRRYRRFLALSDAAVERLTDSPGIRSAGPPP